MILLDSGLGFFYSPPMDAPSVAPSLKEILDRIVQIEARLHKIDDCFLSLFERLEALDSQRVADYYNIQIDQKLEEYERKYRPRV